MNVQHCFKITAYEPIFKPDLSSVHNLESVAMLDGNIQQDTIIAADIYEAVNIFDQLYSIDGHLPNIQFYAQLY